jgi:hypothetical protein
MAKTNRKPEGYAETFLGAAGGPSRPLQDEKKDSYLTIRFTASDIEKIEARALRMGRMSKSQLVRIAVMEYLES